MVNTVTPQQMNLRMFREAYGMPESTVKRLMHTKGFPSYKLGGKWYVDIPAYLEWRKREHLQSYKYA